MSFEGNTFEEEFPSLKDKEGKKVRLDFTDGTFKWYKFFGEEEIQKHTIDKQRAKDEIYKSLGVLISPKCVKPYGDTCGYCVHCKRYQEIIYNLILLRLGLEDE